MIQSSAKEAKTIFNGPKPFGARRKRNRTREQKINVGRFTKNFKKTSWELICSSLNKRGRNLYKLTPNSENCIQVFFGPEVPGKIRR